jgi:hypothetical protein
VAQQIIQADMMLGRDGKEMLEAQGVKFVRQIVTAWAVDFIYCERYGLS